MTHDISVITPTYRDDAELFEELHRSVLAHTPTDAVHHVIVSPGDVGRFAGYAGARCRIWTHADILPRRYIEVPGTGLRLNRRRPWPPIRGWILQQVMKLAVAERIDTRVAVLVDSDVVLVRDVTLDGLVTSDGVRTMRAGGAVHAGMPRHLAWHRNARRLLGLPPFAGLPLNDYVSPLNIWDPGIVRALQRRIEAVTGRSWIDGVCAATDVSEFILYGVFLDAIHGTHMTADYDPCHNYWLAKPLTASVARDFASHTPAHVFGAMVSAKSRTPMDVRRIALGD